MKTAVIRRRVADFLKRYPPFDSISEEDLLEAAGSGMVTFHESEEYVYRQGAPIGHSVWVIQQGRVDVLETDALGEQLRDVLGEGDLLGMDRFAGGQEWRSSARTGTDVVLYAVSARVFESLCERYPAVRQFVSVHFAVSGGVGSGRTSWLDAEPPPHALLAARLARRQAEERGEMAAVPVGASTRTVLRALLEHDAEAVSVTPEGTPGGRVEGILTRQEFALFAGADPISLLREIAASQCEQELTALLHRAGRMVLDGLAQPHDVDDCARVGTAATVAAARARRRWLVESGGAPAEGGCWLIRGEAARGENLAVSEAELTCLSMDGELLRFYRQTAGEPLLNSLHARRSAFDIRMVAGDRTLFTLLIETIRTALRESPMTIPLLANDTLAQLPPLAFFQDLVLDLDGASYTTLDLDGSAVAPMADAARVFALAAGRLEVSGTLDRFHMAATDFPAGAQVFQQAAEAFRIALYYKALRGPRLAPGGLRKLDQRLLKTVFTSVQRLLDFTTATFLSRAA
ncbi:MAG: putative nucleotidyltransferase substrate binding domain-containing protein [Bryobacteraceae bacterium]|nr:putative nucleotidyltransferase substrate binding domain-containing protein [Bryobacteraceae bacterium]